MLRPAEYEDTDDERRGCHEEARHERLGLRQPAQIDDFTECVEEVVKRIVDEQSRVFRRDDFLRIENGRGVAERREQHAVEVEHVPEIDDAGREQEADAEAEYQQEQNGYEKAQQTPGRQDTCIDHHEEDSRQRKEEVDTAREDAREREEVFRNVDFLDERGVLEDGAHREVRRLAEECEHNLPDEEVEDVDRHVEAEERREYHGRDDHHEERIEHAPEDAEDAAAVFLLDVAQDEDIDEVFILVEGSDIPEHRFSYFLWMSFGDDSVLYRQLSCCVCV